MTWTPQSILNAVVAESAKFRAMNRGQLVFYGRLHHKSISGYTAYKTALAVSGRDIDTVPAVIVKKPRRPWKRRTTPRPSRSKQACKRPRDDLSVLTKEILVDARMAGMSNAAIAEQYGFKSSQVKQRCYKLSVPTQAQLGQRPSQFRVRHWDTDKVFSASEGAIAEAFAGRRFEDDRRAVGDGIGPRYRPPARQSYTGCAAAMCAV
jgi:hypothetical protein